MKTRLRQLWTPSLANTRGLFLILFLALVCGVPRAAFAFTPTATEQRIFNLAKNNGGQQRPLLELDPVLSEVARARARDMAQRGYFGHTNPDGNAANYLVRQAGYVLPAHYGQSRNANNIESIAAGYPNGDEAWASWLGSEGHRDHILGRIQFYREQTSIGVGHWRQPGSKFVDYYVFISAPPGTPRLLFATPSSGAKVTTPGVFVGLNSFGAPAAASVQARWEAGGAVGEWTNATAGASSTWSVRVEDFPAGAVTLRVRSRNGSGDTLVEATRGIRYAKPAPLLVGVTGNGKVTNGFLGTTTRETGTGYSITAYPAPDSLFTGWTGGATSSSRTLKFTMREGLEINANFIPNPFLDRAGDYRGLADSGTFNHEGTGRLYVKLTTLGALSGRVSLVGKTYAFKGTVGADGKGTVVISRKGLAPLTINLEFALGENLPGLTATISDGAQTFTVNGRWTDDPQMDRAALAGRYTFLLPSGAGAGYATGTLGLDGVLRLSGRTHDGQKLSTSTRLDRTLRAAVYTTLYKGTGSLAAVLDFNAAEVTAPFYHSKPARSSDRLFPGGFLNGGVLFGARYEAPEGTVLPVQPTPNNARLDLTGGNLVGDVAQPVSLESTNRILVTNPSLPSLSASISTKDGRFTTTFRHSTTGKRTTARGVIITTRGRGYGAFSGIDTVGSVELVPVGP